MWKVGFSLFLLFSTFLLFNLSIDHTNKQNHTNVIAYWHIYWNENLEMESLLQEQLGVLLTSGLYQQLDRIYYTTIGNSSQISLNFLSKLSKFHHLLHLAQGHEVHTLSHLYQHCQQQELITSQTYKVKVLYFHNKGSFSMFHRNADMRRALDCYVLTPACIGILDEFDTCGMRISPIPTPHYTGNFWWATCDYVRTLIDPLSYLNNETFRNLTDMIHFGLSPEWCVGKGRYFAEMWLCSPPVFRAADCLPSFRRSKYLYGIRTPTADLKLICPNFNTTAKVISSSPEQQQQQQRQQNLDYPNNSCGIPFVLRNKQSFRYKIMAEVSSRNSCSTPPILEERSMKWYGKPPITILNWLKSYGQPKQHRNSSQVD